MKFTAAFITCLVGLASAAPQGHHGKNGTHGHGHGKNGTHDEWTVSNVTAETVQGIITNTQ
jgi:hypothetical protein